MSALTASAALPERVRLLMLELCRIVCGAGNGRHPAIAPLTVFLIARFDRIGRRLAGLAERHAAGRLRPPRRRPGRETPSERAGRERPRDPLPRGDAWLLRRLMRPELEQARLNLVLATTTLLDWIGTDPALRALLRDEPGRVGRLLRPLLRMTRGEAEIPEALRLPPRPQRSREKGRAGGRRLSAGPTRGPAPQHPPAPVVAPGAPPPPPSLHPDPPAQKPPAQKPPAQKPLWRVVPVIRVVWTKRTVVRIRAGPRLSRA